MKLFKQFASTLLIALVLVFTAGIASAAQTKDVSKDYWAYKEIESMVLGGYMTVDSNKNFRPEESMMRVEFVSALVKVLGNDNLVIKIKNRFKDINSATAGYESIMRSEQLGLVYGYPDKSFKPERNMTRAETTSVVSHITKDAKIDMSVLSQFVDKNSIPKWAKKAYAKAIKYDLYVNYPDAAKLTPNNDLTRAEAAVLLAKIKNRLDLVKEQYKNQAAEKFTATEHLAVYGEAPSNTVRISNLRKVVDSGNVFKVAFAEKVNLKNWQAGDVIEFYAPKDLYTEEGTLVYPEGTVFKAVVEDVQKARWFNQVAKAGVEFKTAIRPNAKISEIGGHPLKYDGNLRATKGQIGKKLGWYAGGGALVGAGVGIACGTKNRDSRNIGGSMGIGAAIGAPVGAATGVIIGLITPGPNFKANVGDEVYVLLTEDASFWN